MDDAAAFRRRERARRLFDHLERLRDRQRARPAHARLERFAFHQLHRVEAFAILLAVMNHARDVRMMNLRRGARFAQKTSARHRVFRESSADDFERDDGIQDRIPRAVGDRHGTGPEDFRQPAVIHLYFEVPITERHRDVGVIR